MSTPKSKGLSIISDEETLSGGNSAPMSPASSNEGNGGNSSPSLSQSVSNMAPQERIAAIRRQVEYYFSKENLNNDAYLNQQMDAQQSVSMSVIMKFSKMKVLLGGKEALLREALIGSQVCTIQGDRIKANLKAAGRSTIMLRDVPADTPEAEIREIFNYDNCKPIASLRSDIQETWFVEMENETDAKDTLLDLKLKRRVFRGEMVKARLKNEAAVRSYYTQPNMPSPPFGGGSGMNGMSYQQFGAPLPGIPGVFPGGTGGSPLNAGQPGQPMPYPMPVMGQPGMQLPDGSFPIGMMPTSMPSGAGPMDGQQGQEIIPGGVALSIPMGREQMQHGGRGLGQHGDTADPHSNLSGRGNNQNNNAGKNKDNKGNDAGRNGRNGQGNPNSSNASQHGNASGRNQQANNLRNNQDSGRNNAKSNQGGRGNNSGERQTGGDRDGQRQAQGRMGSNQKGGKGSGKGDAGNAGRSLGAMPQPVEVNLMNFPPLHADETPIPNPGYPGEYKKYTADDIINIVKDVREAPLPLSAMDGKTLNPSEHSHSMTSTPNMDLLKRQRSFSIEETREQLQQGKPVHKEAVAGGPVDYSSMIYGDGCGRSASIDDSAPVGPSMGFAEQSKSRSGSNVSQGNNVNNSGNGKSHANTGSTVGQSKARSGSNTSSDGQKKGKKNSVGTPPSASSWAALVKSSASATGTQTDIPSGAGATAAGGQAKGNTAGGSNVKDTGSKKGQTDAGRAKQGQSVGSGTPGRGNKQTDSSGRNAGNEKGTGRNKNNRKKDLNDDTVSHTSDNTEGVESQTPSGWGTKPSFANMLKSSVADEGVPSATQVGKSTSSTGTQSEFSELTISGSRGKKLGTPGTGAAGMSEEGDAVKAAPTIDTTEDGSWARKTLS